MILMIVHGDAGKDGKLDAVHYGQHLCLLCGKQPCGIEVTAGMWKYWRL